MWAFVDISETGYFDVNIVMLKLSLLKDVRGRLVLNILQRSKVHTLSSEDLKTTVDNLMDIKSIQIELQLADQIIGENNHGNIHIKVQRYPLGKHYICGQAYKVL